MFSEEEAQEWAECLMSQGSVPTVQHDEMLARMRDSSLFSFQSAADLTLFMKLVNDGLQLQTCVCLQGSEYIENNVGDVL